MEQFGYHNFSNPATSSLHALNSFQDMYYPSHLYEPSPKHSPPKYLGQPIDQNDQNAVSSDRLWFGGWGASGSSGYGWGGNSAAVSALGLLSFLFFLNLIQNSLINSRWLLLNSVSNTTNLAGRSYASSSPRDLPFAAFGQIGKMGERRSPNTGEVKYESPVSIPINPIDHQDPHVHFVKDPLVPEHKSGFVNATKIPNLQKQGRFRRQVNANNRRAVPLRCLIQFYLCRFKRVFQPSYKYRITNTTQVGFTRRAVRLPVRNRAGNRQLSQKLLLQNGRRTCRTLFNQCRSTATLTRQPLRRRG